MSVKVTYLWEIGAAVSIQQQVEKIIKNSNHRITRRRVNHMACWIDHSTNSKTSLEFLRKNIDSPNFHPFADPWVDQGKSMENLFKTLGGSKIVRLSTRAPGYFTISHTGGISKSKRIQLTQQGLVLGMFRFQSLDELIEHIDNQECCICLEDIVDEVSVILACGHVFHKGCIDVNALTSNSCPMCKQIAVKDVEFQSGASCMYAMQSDFN
jgi:hypothetical protein